MIRAIDSEGVLVLGLSRPVVEKLLATGRGVTSAPQGQNDYRIVVRIYVGETDEKAIEAIVKDYGGRQPLEVVDNRKRSS